MPRSELERLMAKWRKIRIPRPGDDDYEYAISRAIRHAAGAFTIIRVAK